MPELELDQFPDSAEAIPILENPSYPQVFWKHLKRNKPCIIPNVTDNWKAAKRWVRGAKPDFDALVEDYGTLSVPVIACDDNNCRVEKKLLFSDYVRYCTGNDRPKIERSVDYLKDWHLRRERPTDEFYSVPEYFSSDWLNEYSIDKNVDDFMFVYVGAKGSWTPFHEDVYSSFSWSANVVGKKKWILFPPGEELKLADSFGNMPHSILNRLGEGCAYYEIIQNPGEAIFVPSGWFHQVHNLEDTISINHNWVNACNIDKMWDGLMKNLVSVEKEIEEFKEADDWVDHCQLMLRATFGINVDGFIQFITHIANKRIDSIENETPIGFDRWQFGRKHILYDLEAILKLLLGMVEKEERVQIIISNIKNVLRLENENKYLK